MYRIYYKYNPHVDILYMFMLIDTNILQLIDKTYLNLSILII